MKATWQSLEWPLSPVYYSFWHLSDLVSELSHCFLFLHAMIIFPCEICFLKIKYPYILLSILASFHVVTYVNRVIIQTQIIYTWSSLIIRSFIVNDMIQTCALIFAVSVVYKHDSVKFRQTKISNVDLPCIVRQQLLSDVCMFMRDVFHPIIPNKQVLSW